MAGQPIGERFEEIDRMVAEILDHDDAEVVNMGAWHFVNELADRLGRYGKRTFVSAKQLAWLREIHRAATAEEATD